MILKLCTLVGINQALMFESSWKSSDCSNAPNSMVIFDETVNTTILYDLTNTDFHFPTCGNNPIPISKGCCVRTVDFGASIGYQSWSDHVIDPATDLQSLSPAPVTANGNKYCKVMASDAYSLYQYQTVYVLLDGGCTKERMKCNSSSLGQNLYVYTSDDCQVLKNIIPIGSVPVSNASSIVGNVTASLVTVNEGKITFTWTAWVPQTIEIPFNYNILFGKLYGIEYASIVFNVFAIIMVTFKIAYYAYDYYQKPKGFPYYLICNLMWLSWVVLNIAFWMAYFATNFQLQLLSQFRQMAFNLATFMTVAGTASFLLEVRRMYSSRNSRLMYFGLFAFHFVFSGALYFDYWRFQPATGTYLLYWLYLAPVWIFFMFVFDTVPQLLLVGSLIRSNQAANQEVSVVPAIKRFLNTNTLYIILFGIQIVNLIDYIIITYLTNYTQILRDDRTLLAFGGLFNFTDVFHSVLNSFILAELREIVNAFKSKETKKTVSERVRGVLTAKSMVSGVGKSQASNAKSQVGAQVSEIASER